MKQGTAQILAGIDIGSTAVRVAVGRLVEQNGRALLQLIAGAEVAAAGIQRGNITSVDEAVSVVTACLERAERLANVSIDHAVVGVSGNHILSQQSKGVVAVSKPDGEISTEDVRRAVEAARTVAMPVNYEILHVIPKTFTVDGQVGIKDPVGMTGVRLEVDAQIIQGLSAQIKNVNKVIYRTGIEIDEVVLGILAVAEMVTTSRQKELGVAVVNLGAATTSIVVFEEGDVLHTTVLPIGSEHITSDIAIGLRTSIDIAERVKIDYGTCLPRTVGKKEEIYLADLGAPTQEVVDRHYVAEIIEARVEEILQKVDKELRVIERSGLLPAGVLFVGGGAKLDGLVDLAKRDLRLPAGLGYPMDLASLSDKVNDLSFGTAIGLVAWGVSSGSALEKTGGWRLGSKIASANKIGEQVRGWMRSLLP